ncbi:DUF4249 family protein [Sporocytophaga myxococcoides]|uniref:DUF4249 family protein n=1 Tax=Sporocytophaga myxococcoides TaxID=153721 RepID=UPI00040C0BD7|nr:DUF4249 family protein [Sporocytophaga myxococcoides]
MKNKVLLFLLLIGLVACEDKVDISSTLKAGKPALVVDAFITNLPEKQTVYLSSTQYYFDNSGPIRISGASVKVVDETTQQEYVFAESGPGLYVSPVRGDSMLIIGHPYRLFIDYQGQAYTAYSLMKRVPPIDSILFEPLEDLNENIIPGKYFAEFQATDQVGTGDQVWIRNYKNGVRITDAERIGISYDGKIFATAEADGSMFIYPLRVFPVNDNGGEEDDQWLDGQQFGVELFSITEEAATFLQAVVTQSTQGNGGPIGALFSPPPANVPTNIVNTTSQDKAAVGFFCTSAVSRAETIVPNPYGRNQ